MIFVSVGTQLPFDRLIKAMDIYAGAHRDEPVFAQIGKSNYVPQHLTFEKNLSPAAFRQKAEECSVIVSHAGIGNVLLALELGKPLFILPRRAALHEHRNDHQLATATWLEGKPGINVAMTEDDLITRLVNTPKSVDKQAFSPYASPELLACVRDFILQD